MRATAIATVFGLLACTSCSSSGKAMTTQGDASSVCTRASGLADADVAVSGECNAARAFLMCALSGGGGEECLTDDLMACPADVTNPACMNQCAATEYAIGCGGPGPTQAPQPPIGCRAVGVIPGGVQFFCCPCL